MADWLNIGKIVNTHGIKGEVRVISKTDFPEQRYKINHELFAFDPKKTEPRKLTIETYRRHKNFDLLKFKEISSVNDAEFLRDTMLKVPSDDLAELGEDEFYFHQIIGCEVQTNNGDVIGKVKEILTPGANDVWVVKGKKGEILIPYIKDVVKQINIENKVIVIEPMEGLLD